MILLAGLDISGSFDLREVDRNAVHAHCPGLHHQILAVQPVEISATGPSAPPKRRAPEAAPQAQSQPARVQSVPRAAPQQQPKQQAQPKAQPVRPAQAQPKAQQQKSAPPGQSKPGKKKP